MRRFLFVAASVAALLALGSLLLPFLPASPLGARSSLVAFTVDIAAQIQQRGAADTGALNLVSAVYLGYRAFDTLAETIVLVLSVAGALAILGGKP